MVGVIVHYVFLLLQVLATLRRDTLTCVDAFVSWQQTSGGDPGCPLHHHDAYYCLYPSPAATPWQELREPRRDSVTAIPRPYTPVFLRCCIPLWRLAVVYILITWVWGAEGQETCMPGFYIQCWIWY